MAKRLYKDKNALTVSTFKGNERHPDIKPPMLEELMESVHVQRHRLHLMIRPGPAGTIEILSAGGRVTLEAIGPNRFLIRKARKEPGGGI